MQKTGSLFRITDRCVIGRIEQFNVAGFDKCAIMAKDALGKLLCAKEKFGRDGFLYQKKRTSPFIIFFRIVFTCCLIYSVVFIFQNSLQIAEESSLRSEQVQQIVNEAAGTVGLGPFSLHVIRKMAHFTEFMMMGFWFMLCLRVYTRHFIKHISWPLFLGLGTAVTDETIQLFVEGRGSSVKDVWIDFGGFLVGLFVALLILMFFRMCAILFIHRHDDQLMEQPQPPVRPAKKRPAPRPQPEEEWEDEWEEEPEEEPENTPPARPAKRQEQAARRQSAQHSQKRQTRWEPVPEEEHEEEEENYDTSIEY